MNNIFMAIPNKGRLHYPSVKLLQEAGIIGEIGNRELFVKTRIRGLEILLARAADIPKLVASGSTYLGITGADMVVESRAKVRILQRLGFGYADIVVAGLEDAFKNRKKVRIATELPRIAKLYCRHRGVDAEIIEVSGACEIMPRMRLSDLIIDITSTGTTLRLHGLKILDKIMKSEAYLIGYPGELPQEERETFNKTLLAIRSTVNAENMRMIMMNVPEDILEEVVKIMPGMGGPTVARIESKENLLEVYAVVREEEVFDIVVKAKKIGARDIIVLKLEKVIP
ncbi:ATP phosphoribosyltransferase [archaeon]|nr:MAG: ATP phosphoribosyltransferase [archaeon]